MIEKRSRRHSKKLALETILDKLGVISATFPNF